MQGILANSRVFQQINRQEKKQNHQNTVEREQLPTVLARQSLLPSERLEDAVLECKSPFLGVVPDVFSKDTKASEQDIIKSLDGLAKQLKRAKTDPDSLPASIEIAGSPAVGSPKQAIQIDKVGSGFWGDVYKLRVKDQDFVMKVFGEPDMAYSETAIGMYYTQGRQTSDLSKLFAANPTNSEAPWTLMEFIPATAKLEDRAGQTLAEQGARISDHNDKNLVNRIRVDHGGTVTVKDTLFRPPVGLGAKPKQARRIIFPVPE